MGWLERTQASAARHTVPTLEELFAGPAAFSLDRATPLQRAICRIADGRPLGDLAEHPHIRLAVGDLRALPLGRPPKLLVVVAAIRGGKSLLAAAGGYRAAQVCPLDDFTAGEIPRVPIVSIHKDVAKPTMDHLVGALTERPSLRATLDREPTSDTVTLRHPLGRLVEVRVTAGARAGATLAARWLPAAIFDEAPRMLGSDAGIVNLDDMLRTIDGRMLGPVWLLGSPWAPFGPVYDLVQEHHGHPSADCVVIRARGDWLNPHYWTPERQQALQRHNPLAYRTDYEADFADPAEALIPAATVERCTREGPAVLAREPGHAYAAAIDPGTRSNAWTLAVGTRDGDRVRIVLVRQWVPEPGRPLDPDRVLGEIRAQLDEYGCRSVDSDDWSGDALTALARRHGLTLVPYADGHDATTELYLELARRMALAQVEIPRDGVLRGDLVRVMRLVTQTGISVHLPRTGDGRHCDYAPAVARVVRAFIPDARPAESPTSREQSEVLDRMQDRWRRRSSVPIWRRTYGGSPIDRRGRP